MVWLSGVAPATNILSSLACRSSQKPTIISDEDHEPKRCIGRIEAPNPKRNSGAHPTVHLDDPFEAILTGSVTPNRTVVSPAAPTVTVPTVPSLEQKKIRPSAD